MSDEYLDELALCEDYNKVLESERARLRAENKKLHKAYHKKIDQFNTLDRMYLMSCEFCLEVETDE